MNTHNSNEDEIVFFKYHIDSPAFTVNHIFYLFFIFIVAFWVSQIRYGAAVKQSFGIIFISPLTLFLSNCRSLYIIRNVRAEILCVTISMLHWNLACSSIATLTHLHLVPHICVEELDKHWFRWWLVAYSAPSHFMNKFPLIVNWTLRNKVQWNLNQIQNFSFMKMRLKMSSGKWRPFCPAEDDLKDATQISNWHENCKLWS